MARPKKFRLSPDEVLEPTYAKKLAGHVAEIELFRSQVATLQQQIADIYDAADDDGFDKKFVRLAVGRRAKDALALAATEEAVDAYTKAIETGLSSRVREENPEHDPETGEFVTARIQSSSGALTAKTAVLITTPNPAPPASQDNGGGPAEETDLASSADTLQEGSEPIEAHNLDRAGSTPAPATSIHGGPLPDSSGVKGMMAEDQRAGAPEAQEGQTTRSDGNKSAPAHGPIAEGVGVTDDSKPVAQAAAPVANSEPGKGELGETPSMAQRQATGEASAPASPVVPTAADNARKIRPWCLHADDLTKCGGYGRVHCHPCLVAHADAEGMAA